MPKAPVNGTELYYESHGEGPAIVFAHQRAGNHLTWWQQVPVLSKKYRCVTYDQRGWGASVQGAGGPGLSAGVEDRRQLLDHLGIARTFLVGHSMGGITCLGFALAHPERTLGLILVDTTAGVGDPAVLAAITDLVNLPAGDVPRTLSARFIEQRPELTFLYEEISGINPELNLDIRSAFHNPAGLQAADLAKLSVPTLLMVGEEDVIFPEKAIRAMQGMILGAKLEVVPGTAHVPQFEVPDVFNRLVGDFFSGVLSGNPTTTG